MLVTPLFLFGYNGDLNPLKTGNATKDHVIDAAKKIYQGCPEFLAALGLD
jgi:hypothetical protein